MGHRGLGVGISIMSILVDKNTRLLVQGITGREGLFHTEHMVAYGTKGVAGPPPGEARRRPWGGPVLPPPQRGGRLARRDLRFLLPPPAVRARRHVRGG